MAFKICVIGCGGIAMSSHGPAYRRYADLHPEVELVGCCDLDERKAAAFGKRIGFARHYTDFAVMLTQEKPHAVAVLTPPDTIPAIAIAVMRRGYPVLMEKPPGATVEACQEIVSAAKDTGMHNMVAFNRRYAPLTQRLRGCLTQVAAEVEYIHCQFNRVRRLDPDFSTTTIHGIDTVRHLSGSSFEQIQFHYQEKPTLGPGVCNIYMDGRMISGARVQLAFCPVSGYSTERYTVCTQGHTFILDMPLPNAPALPGALQCYDPTGAVVKEVPESMGLSEAFGFYGEIATFCDALRAGSPIDDIATALQSVAIADCIRRRETQYRCQI